MTPSSPEPIPFHGPDFARRCWSLAVNHPIVSFALILALQVGLTLSSRELWFSDEIRYADVFSHLLEEGKWLVLYLNGEPYPDKPPLYFLFLAGLVKLLRLHDEWVLFLGSALTGLSFLAATYGLARIAARVSREEGLTAGLMLLTCFYFSGVCHYIRMDLLFATLITISHICLFQGLTREENNAWTVTGGVFAGLAVLTKGPLGLAFPLATCLAFLVWTGRPGRMVRKDTGLGLLTVVLLLAAWGGGALLVEGTGFVTTVLDEQIYQRAVDAWHHKEPFLYYVVALPLTFLPWTLLALTVPFGRLLSSSFWKKLIASRRQVETWGVTFVWCQLVAGFVLLSVLSTKIAIYLLPLFAPLAIVGARQFLAVKQKRLRLLLVAVAGLFVLAALAAPWVNMFHPWPMTIEGLWPSALTLLLAALALWLVRGSDRRAVLLVLVLGVSAVINVVALTVAPSMDAVMSPKAQAEVMRGYIDKGYVPVAYKLYSGSYSYHTGHVINETSDQEVMVRMVNRSEKAVVAMREKHWEYFAPKLPGLHKVHEQWLVDRNLVLAVKGE